MGKFLAYNTYVEHLQAALTGMSNEDKGWKGYKHLLSYVLTSQITLIMKWIIIQKLLVDWTNMHDLELFNTTIHVKSMKILILTLLRLNKHLLQFKLLWRASKTNQNICIQSLEFAPFLCPLCTLANKPKIQGVSYQSRLAHCVKNGFMQMTLLLHLMGILITHFYLFLI